MVNSNLCVFALYAKNILPFRYLANPYFIDVFKIVKMMFRWLFPVGDSFRIAGFRLNLMEYCIQLEEKQLAIWL